MLLYVCFCLGQLDKAREKEIIIICNLWIAMYTASFWAVMFLCSSPSENSLQPVWKYCHVLDSENIEYKFTYHFELKILTSVLLFLFFFIIFYFRFSLEKILVTRELN